MSIAPEFCTTIWEVDIEFASTDYFQKMKWLKTENNDLYDPDYTDLLRVAFTSEFNRGKLADLVSLLSGRNFETRTYEDEIVKQSFASLEKGILNFINETNFKRFVMIIKSAGFVTQDLIRSQNTLNFAYILYLKLKSKGVNPADIESYVRRWFVMSVLTGRYSGSAESWFDFDIRNISSGDFADYILSIEKAGLSDAFWDTALVQKLNTSISSSPYFNVFLASQVKSNDKGFLSKDITVHNLIVHKGDIHHIFPRDFLKKNGFVRGDYNQIANYVYTQSEINIKIGNKEPKEYLSGVNAQCNGGELVYGGISDEFLLYVNFEENCIPRDVFSMNIQDYKEFLNQRRELMARKIKAYYYSL